MIEDRPTLNMLEESFEWGNGYEQLSQHLKITFSNVEQKVR
jgi:hypothetical protein